MERKGRPKERFKHFTQIPTNLRDKGIDTLDLANEFQSYLLEGRAKEIPFDAFPWIVWNSKYFFSRNEKKWKERDAAKPISKEAKLAILDRIIELFRNLESNKSYKYGYQEIQDFIEALSVVMISVKNAESELTVEGAPEREEEIGTVAEPQENTA